MARRPCAGSPRRATDAALGYRTSRARLDALYFHLYGIGRDDADYILSTFLIVERQDRTAHGRYLTRDLISRR